MLLLQREQRKQYYRNFTGSPLGAALTFRKGRKNIMYFTGKENVAVEVAEKKQNKAVEGYVKQFAKRETEKYKGKRKQK